jgi:glycerol-3-phosphate acyltransferase PlsY
MRGVPVVTDLGLAGVVLIGAYLLGSALFGVIILRALTGEDPRGAGSGSPGATNVMRIAGKRLGSAALALDAGKGAVAVLLARSMTPEESVLPAAAAVAAVLGHVFPVFHRFRGGKGVATGLGAFLAVSYRPVLASLVVFLVVLAAFRFVSLASMVAAISLAPFCLICGESSAVSWAAAVTGALIVVRHHDNIARLRDGVEPRLGGSALRGP